MLPGLYAEFTNEVQRGTARGYVRENQGIEIDHDQLRRLYDLKPLSVMDKAGRLLKFFAENHPIPGLQIKSDSDWFVTVAAGWLSGYEELQWILQHVLIRELNWLDGHTTSGTISPKGWVALDEMKKPASDPSKCFVAMWFSKEVQSLFDDAILPAAKDAGYEAERVDMIQHNQQITDEIIAGVRRGKFLIADFTKHRGGVYFEAGFALGLGKQVIWLIREDDLADLHFDNRQYNFILWSPDKLDELRTKLRLRIEATQGRGPL